MNKTTISIIILSIIAFMIISPSLLAEESQITLEFYYSSNCGTCTEKLDLIQSEFENNENFSEFLTVIIKDIVTNDVYLEEWEKLYDFYPYPFVILKTDNYSTDPIDEFIMTYDYLNQTINEIRFGNETNHTTDENIIHTPFGDINISDMSLPILTIILGGLDSFNPCAFFILIFLLNLLIYAKSRKRMLLIGGIFIFFSGLLYMIFMFLLFEFFFAVMNTTGNILIVTIIAGIIALSLGVFNIKDFFFFKKGASISIPDSKKPGIYKKMRGLVKNPRLTAVIIGTIILAGTVNFYELLCTLGLPLVFTKQLADQNLASSEYFMYILFYNIVYVIPLIIIVFIFVITLGRRKLTEWHGQIMKLISGIMLTSFGLLFLYNYQLLENVVTPILLLLFSVLLTAVIAFIWKKYHGIKELNK
jgi:hypothetical protein